MKVFFLKAYIHHHWNLLGQIINRNSKIHVWFELVRYSITVSALYNNCWILKKNLIFWKEKLFFNTPLKYFNNRGKSVKFEIFQNESFVWNTSYVIISLIKPIGTELIRINIAGHDQHQKGRTCAATRYPTWTREETANTRSPFRRAPFQKGEKGFFFVDTACIYHCTWAVRESSLPSLPVARHAVTLSWYLHAFRHIIITLHYNMLYHYV